MFVIETLHLHLLFSPSLNLFLSLFLLVLVLFAWANAGMDAAISTYQSLVDINVDLVVDVEQRAVCRGCKLACPFHNADHRVVLLHCALE